jgi:hypothetical protein
MQPQILEKSGMKIARMLLRIKPAFIILLYLTAILLPACAGGAGDAAETVETYMQAKVDGDADKVRELLCSEMEAVYEREIRTFDSVTGVHIEGMSCQQEGESTTVRCEGTIVAVYGAEETEFPLVAYRVAEEDGIWKWCGEAP